MATSSRSKSNSRTRTASAASKGGSKKSTKKKTAKKKASKVTAKKPAKKKTAKKKASGKAPPRNKTGASKKASATKRGASKKAASKARKAAGKAKKAAPKKKGALKKKGAETEKDRKRDIRRAVTKAESEPAGKKKKRGTKKARKAEKASASVPPPPPSSKRNFGLRGAAPWVARHAAKHAEELRKRNAEPPPPGSARATLRVPPQAEQIKSKIGELHQLTSRVRALRKKLDKSFFEIGEVLAEVQRKELHVAKGYSSFESFLDREIDLPRSLSLKLVRISHTFQVETAYDYGLERLSAALAALDGELQQQAASHPSSRSLSSTAIPPKPPIRYDD